MLVGGFNSELFINLMMIKVNNKCEVHRQCKGFQTTRLSSSRLQMGLLKHLSQELLCLDTKAIHFGKIPLSETERVQRN